MTFQRIATTLAIASFTLAAGSARAETATFTVYADGDPAHINGFAVSAGQSVAAWRFSEILIGAMSVVQATPTGVAPGSVMESDEELRVDMPLRSVSGVMDSDRPSAAIQRAGFAGGVRLDVPGVLFNGRKNIASTGGSLTLSDFKIDFVNKGVYVTLEGGNDVGVKHNQLLWTYGDVQGATAVGCNNGIGMGLGGCSLDAGGLQVGGLTITSQAFDLIGASLGLTDFGHTALRGVPDYGTLTISSVPEMSSSWMLLTGLAALGARRMARRARAG